MEPGKCVVMPKTLHERIADASSELKLARRDGDAEWICKAREQLDSLIDELPRIADASAL